MSSDQTVGLPRPELSAARRALIEARLRGQVRASGIVPRAHRGPAPLSFAQERLWFLDRMEPGSTAYNVAWPLRLRGAPDTGALERALGEIVRRHESLRTVFRETGGAPVQVAEPFGGFALRTDDLSGLGDAEREAEMRRRVAAEASRPFDLAAGPLFRAVLLRLGEQDHVLLLGMHHIVSDGWSMGVLAREFSVLYEAYRAGRESPLPPLAVQYADYAAWQREHLRGQTLERHLAYWRERLADAPALLELPADHPRPPVQTFRGANEGMLLSAGLLERLRELGRSEGATLYMVVLAAFQVLLSRYSGSGDIVVGSPVAGRGRREVEGLIGFFVNTLVLRTDLSGDPGFRETLRRVREVTLGAYEHQELPFEKLVAELQPERSLSHSPLFQVSFTLVDAEEAGSGLAELGMEEIDPDLSHAKFDLSLAFAATPRGLSLAASYATDLFERGTIVRMLRHLERVLEQVAQDPARTLSRLELLDEAERRTMAETWNRTERPYPRNVCIHALFEAQVRERPDALALVWGAESLTYRELDARANRLAHHLVRRGVAPEARVGVLLERSAELVVCLLAVLKAGGCYVPLDPEYPPERLRLMLADSGVRVLLSRGGLAGRVEAGGVDVVHLDQLSDAPAPESAPEPLDAPRGGATAENLAYIVYTSGSTGRPKGIMVGHRQVVQLVVETDYVQLRPGDRVAQASNAAFDALTFEVWGALLNGATLVGLSREVLLATPVLRRVLREERITTLFLTTALLNQLSHEEPDIFSSLREVLFGGQAVDAGSVRRLLRAGKPRRLLHMYGPTETTTFCLYEPVEHVAEDALTVPLGHATGNQRIYLLDAALDLVPPGVPGEACVGGAGVARGYLDRPGLTAERFVPDPFSAEPGARMYRTGDRLRWRGERKLEFVGRLDEQVKIRGFRIEPGEVESALSAHAAVREAWVGVREDSPGEKRLVAYVAGEVEAEAVRAYLQGSLPEYMVPSAVVVLERLPLTPNGKVDRRALPAPDYAAAAGRYVAPRTPVEEVLAGIWAEVLRIERVGVHDHFFELGGHSLLAVQVISRVRQALAVEAELGQVFTRPVLQDFARGLETAARTELPPVEPVPRGDRLPLSFAQQRLWFLEQLGNLGSTYHVPTRLRLRGALDRVALARALDGIVARHEALRTTFAEVDGAPEQRIAPAEAGFHLVEHDLAGRPDAELQRVMAEEAGAPFDLRRGPLVRGRLVRLADDDHVLLLTLHHIVSDGWSMGVLFEELSALYAAHREGRDAQLAALPVQYADYAAWQRRWVEGDVLREQAEYWTRTLAGAPRLLELPTDRPRPAETDHAGALFHLYLDAELTAGLKALSRRHGTTLYMTLLAGWAAVLGRLSGQDDVVIGTPTAGRGRREIEGLIGFFINTLAVRVDLSGAPTVAELLGRVRERTLGAQHNQDIPFEQVVERVSAARSLSHTPLFQVMFTWQNAPGGAGISLPGLDVDGVGAERVELRAKFDLSLTMHEADDRIAGSLTYATSLLDRETVERWAGYLRRVLREMAAGEHRPVERLALLSGGERARVLEAWNRTGAAFAGESCLHALVEAQVQRTPGATAVVFEGESLTYAELNRRANRLAHHLRALGVGPGARVGLCLERSLEMMVGLLAVLKAGGAYVPLDPAYPAERLAYMLADSSPAVVLSQRALRDRIAGTGAPVLELDEAAPAWGDRPVTDPERGTLTPGHLAYVIYTSGSTGRPKGVEVPHRAVANALRWMQDLAGLSADDAVLHKTPYSFDASLRELLPPLLVGARLVLARPEGHRDPGYLLELMRRERITTLHAVPSLLQALVDEGGLAACGALRTVMCGGEALPAELVRRFAGQAPWARLYNVYGPTEAAVDVTAWPCTGRPHAAATTPIGSPMANVRIYLLDPAGEPVPVGVAGELHVGGVQVARGYRGRAALTAERFVPDPFGADAGSRLYRTGDRARWRADGAIEYLGRIDFQVKVRGFRIEPGEIEAVLRRHEGVADCVVLARAEAGEPRLVAYVVGEAGAEALRAHVRASLPEYMVPAAFVRLDALPLMPNGKLDRKALPAPDPASVEDQYVAPRTPAEEVLAGIWAETLRLERVGVEEGFFDLGGHSLLATRVVSRIRALFGVELPLRALFEGPTVAELAVRVEEMRRAGLPVLPPVVPVERTRGLPLSFAQERLWFIDRLEPGSTVYNMPWPLRLRGTLDAGALERALGEIVRRHEALRTVFADRDGSPVQTIAPFAGFTLPVEDLSDEAEREAAVRRHVDLEAGRPFDLAAGPLFRAALLRVDAGEHVLLLGMHHIVSDGWSMGVLFRELSALYGAYREGGESPLAELPVQYADYAVWQREQLEGEVLERQLGYWRERLSGAPELLELPADHPRPPVQTYRGATVPMEFSPALLERLQALGRREGATLYMVLLSAFQVLLGKYAGSDDVVVGSPIAGRTRGEVEGLIGFFINTLVLRTDLSGNPGFRETLRRVRETTLGAYEHQEVPFEKLVAELQPERSMSHAPLFQVMFTLQNARDGGGTLAGLEVGGVAAGLEIAKFDLSLTLSATAQGLGGGLNYSTDLFEPETIQRMVRHLERVLEQVATDADVRFSELDLLGEAERATVLAEWNQTDRPYPRGVGIHDLFDAQVRERPDAVALSWGDESLTYAELDARANQLAHHLVRRGVGPDVRVGVLLERSAELIVSLLAVIKAGGAYVPLDPAYPAERLRLMLADSSVRVLLSRSDLASAVPGCEARVVCLDGLDDVLPSEPITVPRSGATAENLAYIVYTSGSTGKPKGVMVAHRHVVQLVVETDYVQLRPGDRVAQASNASFDALTFEAWGAFLNGATLVGIDRDVLLSPSALRAFLREERITTLYQTTALLNQLSREQPDVFAPLREVLFGGQAADADSVRRLLKAGGPARLLHMYGPTETTAWCSWELVEHVAEDALTVSVGRATGNQRIYLLDSALNPVPVGVPGEAYVGGAGVVRGYLDRPGLTAERFVPDPFATEPGARMYRTGDRLRWKADGRLEFVGRVDEQVKIRGFRIEPGEIEAVLSSHAEVREARVIMREDQPGEPRLVAYVVGAVDVEALREHLRASLPEYMVPAAFVVVDQLPLTPNGKLDVRALPVPELGSAVGSSSAPGTPVEEVLAGTWADVLRLERVGVKDNFFELGGHSLLAIRVVSRIRAVFGVELPLRALFEGPTVAELAGRVEEMRRADLPVLPPVVPVERTGALPLSFAQERLWFLDRLQPGSAAYNIPVAWRLEGALEERALERALGEIVRRHEALRTAFADRDGAPVQTVAPFRGFSLPVEDLSALDEAEREGAVTRRAGEAARQPFDLAAGPLFRAVLLRLGAEEHVLLLGMHHIVSDGWSMGILFRELSALYAAYSAGGESPLPALAVHYADYAVWQREQLAGEALDRQLAYWRERLWGAPALLELPTDRPRPPLRTHRGARVAAGLPAGLLERLQALGRSEGATLYMVLLGAFQVLLSKYSGSEDVVVGSPIAGRTRREVEELIGFFVNTLVLRTDLSGDPSFRETLRRVRETTLGAYEHQELPFEKLVAELQPERSLSHSPLFQVSFSLTDTEGSGPTFPGLRIEPAYGGSETAKFDLGLAFLTGPEGLQAALTYSTDLFDPGTIRRMLAHLQRVLEQVAADGDLRLSELQLLDDAERHRVLGEWNATEAEYPANLCIHQLFEAQAERTPGAVAVVYGGESVPYAELNARANQLAHYLKDRGVGPDVRVGISMERSLALPVALLSVLKAGGTYVPLDPAYPADRLRQMLEDSRPVVLLTAGTAGTLFADAGVPAIDVDADAPAWASRPETNPDAADLTPDHLCYVIYTSGSTGRPKGVMNPHRCVVNRLVWGQEAWGVGAAMLHQTSLNFDGSLRELFWPWSVGARVVLARPEGHRDPDSLLATIHREGITTVNLVPSMLQLLLEDPRVAERCAGLERVLCGGEALPEALLHRFHERLPHVALHNLYGPSEAATALTALHCTPEQARATVPIGRPTGNVRIYLLDGAGRPVPVGVPGELYIGGVGVARGYLDRPALTAEKFVPDPFGGTPGARLYRTGDLCRWLADGRVEFMGRNDFQVKIRGFRIELGEVEAALRRHAGVADCVVVAREDRPGDRRLVAYVAADPNAADAADAAALREHLRRTLPEYMVPAAFVVLDRLPLNANGKLDRRALPEPDYGAAPSELVEPRNWVEVQLIGIWEELLGVHPIGATQSFFDHGGTSLLAVRLFARVNRAFGCDLPVATLFAGATVRQMADAVLAEKGSAPAARAPVVVLQPGQSLPPLFCVHATDRDVLGYVGLVRHLGAGQPVYGVRDLGEDLSRPLARIAAEHVEAIRSVQPEGPYALAGWSFGGLVAFEIALQLERRGEAVAFLGLLDSISPVLAQRPTYSDLGIVLGVGEHVARRTGRTLSLAPGELEGLETEEQIRRVVDHLQGQGPPLPALDYGSFGEEFRAMRDRIASSAAYVPGTLRGTLTLFRAMDHRAELGRSLADEEERRTLGWSRLCADPVVVRWVPGNHVTMTTEPHVRALAESMRESLGSTRLRAPAGAGGTSQPGEFA